MIRGPARRDQSAGGLQWRCALALTLTVVVAPQGANGSVEAENTNSARSSRPVACAAAQTVAAPSFVVRAGRIMPVAEGSPWIIERGVMIVRDGRIERIGSAGEIEIPHDLAVLDLPDMTIVPGFVAASTRMIQPHAGDESISGAYAAVDSFDRYGDYRTVIGAGVTTVHLNPGTHRLISGRGAVVRLGGYHDERVLSEQSDLAVNLGPDVFGPPELQQWLIPPTGDQPILPSVMQRPSTRLGQFLALREALEPGVDSSFDFHGGAYRQAWHDDLPLRITAQRAADLAGAVSFLRSQRKRGYLVGGIELLDAVDSIDLLRESGVGLIYTIDSPLRSTNRDLGVSPDVLEGRLDDLAELRGLSLAIATVDEIPISDLRMVAATAMRAGLDEEQVLAAITRTAAEIIGVGDRVGSLEPGKEADFLVMSGHPLQTTSHVHRAYIRGRLVYRIGERQGARDQGQGSSPQSLATDHDPIVVRGGMIWLGPDDWLRDGSILIEHGRITAVGRGVPHPPAARVIDAGEDSFITPGFIDAHGHLGLRGDRSTLAPQLTLARLVGAPNIEHQRVVHAGVTTVITAPYSFHNSGSQVSAIKTAGETREERVVRSTAAVAFSVRGLDPVAIPGRFRGRIDAGKKYRDEWRKYEQDLAEWRKKRDEGRLDEQPAPPQVEETQTRTAEDDPITGTWAVRVHGGPLPEQFEGRIAFRLTGGASGGQVEGRVIEPTVPLEHRIVGTLDGRNLSGTIEVDTGGMGTPTWKATITEPDTMSGSITLQMFTIEFNAQRVDRGAVEFRVQRTARRTTGRDGRPLPPKVDESLEPIRAWLDERIPALIEVSTTQEIEAVVKFLVVDQKLPIVLLNAENAASVADMLRTAGVGVIVPTSITRRRDFESYHQPDDLTRQGVYVAFQSNAEDGARLLPLVGMHAVERGMSAEQALAAMTRDAARLYKLDHRLGMLEPGRDGDLVIFSGHPFDTSSRVLRVLINGREVQR